MRKYFQPASFFIKETSIGLYTSSHPLIFPQDEPRATETVLEQAELHAAELF